MRRTPWNARRLNAARSAVAAMLAGEDKAGDWPEDVERVDLERALERLNEEMDKRASKR